MALTFSVKFSLKYRKGKGLLNAQSILAREFKGALAGIGKRLKSSSQIRMRRDTGEERKSLIVRLEGSGLSQSVIVYSTLLHAFLDAYGMRPGVRVPYGFGSRLHQWVQRRIRFGHSEAIKGLETPYSGEGPKRVFQGRVGKIRQTTPLRNRRITTGAKVKGINRVRNRNNQAKRLAFLAARAIFQRGIKGSSWNRKALEANRGRIIRDLKNALSRAALKMQRG